MMFINYRMKNVINITYKQFKSMNTKSKILMSILIVILFVSNIIFAQGDEFSEPRIPGAKYTLDLFSFIPWMSGGSARFIGMGGTGIALSNDASTVEYNPAGLAYLKNINLSLLTLGEVNKVPLWNENQENLSYKYEFNFIPIYAAFALSNFGVAYKKPFIPSTLAVRADGGYWTSYAPDTYPMKFDFYSDKVDNSKLNTFSLGFGKSFGPLALGANLTYIKGEVSRKVDGIWFNSDYYNGVSEDYTQGPPGADSQFHSFDQAMIDGFTLDLGAILNLSLVKVGLVYRNAYSSINYTRDYMWHDDFVTGHYGYWWTYDPPAETYSNIKLPSFFNIGTAIDLGAIKLALDLENFDLTYNFSSENWNNPKNWRYGTLHAGVEFWILPILALRAGAYGNIRFEEIDPTQAAQLAVRGLTLTLGAGVNLLGFSVDLAVLGEQINNISPDFSNIKFIASGSAKF